MLRIYDPHSGGVKIPKRTKVEQRDEPDGKKMRFYVNAALYWCSFGPLLTGGRSTSIQRLKLHGWTPGYYISCMDKGNNHQIAAHNRKLKKKIWDLILNE